MKFLPTIVLISIIGLIITLPRQSYAVTGIEVSPAFLDVTIDASKQQKEIPITFTNHTKQEITLDLFPIDFKQQDDFGKIGFLGLNSSYSYSLSSFISFATRQIIIPAGKSKQAVVTITNRDDLSPGGHYAAVVGKLANDEKKDPELSTQVSPSLSSLLLVHKKGGERFNLSLLSTSWPTKTIVFSYPRVFSLHFQNEGNIHVTPYGRIEVRDIFGRLLSDGMINPSSLIILPESRRYVDGVLTPLQISLPISLNTLSIKGHDSGNKTQYVYKEVFIYINPWLGLLIAIIPTVILIKWRRHHKK